MLNINLPRYERIWLTAGGATLVLFLILFAVLAVGMSLNPPGHMTTIDPEQVYHTPPFDKPGVAQVGPNEYVATYVVQIFSYDPPVIDVPAGATVHFQATSPDVVHGLYVPGTNINMMVLPGHITEFTYSFKNPGEYLILCHEYCGVGHHLMVGRINVH